MKNSQLSTLITIAFFGAFFLLAFSSEDSNVGMMRSLIFLAAGCVLSICSFYYRQVNFSASTPKVNKLDNLLKDAHKFSAEYGDLYVLVDKLKQQRKMKHRSLLQPRV